MCVCNVLQYITQHDTYNILKAVEYIKVPIVVFREVYTRAKMCIGSYEAIKFQFDWEFSQFIKLHYNDSYNNNEESTEYYYRSGLHIVSVTRSLVYVKFTATDYSD